MKKIMLLMLAVCFMAGIVSAQNKQEEKLQTKMKQKELKAKMKMVDTKLKDLKKDGWKIFASSKTLEVALLEHQNKMLEKGVSEVKGIASLFKSKNVGYQMAHNSAASRYGRLAGEHIRGRIESVLKGDGNNTDAEMDNFQQHYASTVEKEIKGELIESYSIIREKGNGEYEMESYFIVNEDAAHKARIRAFENTLKEEKLAQEWGESVRKYVDEAFKTE